MSEVEDCLSDLLDARDAIERAVAADGVSSLSGEDLGGHRRVHKSRGHTPTTTFEGARALAALCDNWLRPALLAP